MLPLCRPGGFPWPSQKLTSTDGIAETEAQLWPVQFDSPQDLEAPCATAWDRMHRRWCPSSGYLSLYHIFSKHWAVRDFFQQFRVDDTFLRKTIHVEGHDLGGHDSWAYTTHGAVAGGQDVIVDYHTDALNTLMVHRPFISSRDSASILNLADYKVYKVETTIPLVRTFCALQPTMTIENATTKYSFPKIERFRAWRNNDHFQMTGDDDGPLEHIDVFKDVLDNFLQSNITIESPADIPEAIMELENIVVPVSLPAHFNGTIGLVFNRINTDDTALDKLLPVDVNTCLVDARLVVGRSTQRSEEFVSLHQRHDSGLDRIANNVMAGLGPVGWTDEGLTINGMPDITELDRGQIRMTRQWFSFMSPFISDERSPGTHQAPGRPNRTTLERITFHRRMPSYINASPYDARQRWRIGPEIITSAYFADSLSRCGEDTVYGSRDIQIAGINESSLDLAQRISTAAEFLHYGEPTARLTYVNQAQVPQNESFAEIRMEAVFTGYVMYWANAFDIFCIVLLLLHAAIALAHTVICFTKDRRETHETWDSIPQLVALAQQSPPAHPKLLDNTCGGIKSFKTAAAVAVVEVRHEAPAAGVEDLQLRFASQLHKGVPHANVVPVAGKMYGLKR